MSKTFNRKSAIFDFAVIGAGPAGCIFSSILSNKSFEVIIIEREEEDSTKLGVKIGETLPPQASPLLRELGLQAQLESADHLHSFGTKSAWGAPEVISQSFLSSGLGHGWHLDRRLFETSLRHLTKANGTYLLCGRRLADIEYIQSVKNWKLTLTTGESITARFLIDASGRRRIVSKQQGVHIRQFDRLIAIAAVYEPTEYSLSEDRDSQSLIEAFEYGWWYTALIPRGRRLFVRFSDSDSNMNNLKSVDDFSQAMKVVPNCAEIVEKYQYKLIEGPLFQPASSTIIEPSYGLDWLAIGDAVSTYDPLSSQGILTAIEDGIAAAESLQDYWSGQENAFVKLEAIRNQRFERYLDKRDYYYAIERRWPQSPFWELRHP